VIVRFVQRVNAIIELIAQPSLAQFVLRIGLVIAITVVADSNDTRLPEIARVRVAALGTQQR
jgi:hypothetical protein